MVDKARFAPSTDLRILRMGTRIRLLKTWYLRRSADTERKVKSIAEYVGVVLDWWIHVDLVYAKR